MKLIYLHQYFVFPDETGGTRSYDLASSFVQKGYNVTVVTATSDEKYHTKQRWTVIEREGLKINYIYLPYGNHLSYLQRILVFFQFLWFSSFRLLKIKADVVLATSTPLTIGIPALIKKWFGKTPYIFEVRDVWPEAVIAIGVIRFKITRTLLFALEKMIYKNAVAIVPLSTDMQKSICSRYPEFSTKCRIVIENISEIDRFQNNEKKIDIDKLVGFMPRFSVLYAGTFGKVNGIHHFIELAKHTVNIDKGLVYFLIGNGAEKDEVIRLAKKSGVLNQNVFILDAVTKDELPAWYNSVSMGSSFVINLKELWANSANKFFDTLAAGKPVLINHEGWQADAIRTANVGYVQPFAVSMQDAIDFVNYTKNDNLIQLQKENALKLARTKYSLDIALDKYTSVFSSLKFERSES